MEFTVEEAALRGGGTFTNDGANPAAGSATGGGGGASAGGEGGGNGTGGTPAGGGGGNTTPPGAAWNPNHVMRNLEADHVPVDEEEEQAMARIVSYMASRGPEGREDMLTWIEAGRGKEWLKFVEVHGAVANNHLEEVKTLVLDPDMASDVDGADASNGYRPLHMATVWGRPSMAVLLLSLGADPSLRSEPVPGRGQLALTPFDMSRQRLSRLTTAKLDTHEDIEIMRAEGRELVEIFSAIEAHNNVYKAWAKEATNNKHVMRHSPNVVAHAQRTNLGVLRELVLAGRAFVLTSDEIAAKEAQLAAESHAAAIAAAGPPQTLEEAMEAEGLLKEGVAGGPPLSGKKVMLRQMHKFLEVTTLEELATVSREDIAALDEIDPSERRKLWQFVQARQPKQTFAMAMAADKGTNGAEGAASSGKKKASTSGKKKKDDGLAALLAEGVSGKGASASKQGKKKNAPAPAAASPAVKATGDGSAASSNGGTKESANDKSGGASRNESSSVSGANNKNAADGTVVENGGGSAQGVGVEGYTRHWPDEPSVLAFMFRPDLPTDAFTVIAMQLYN